MGGTQRRAARELKEPPSKRKRNTRLISQLEYGPLDIPPSRTSSRARPPRSYVSAPRRPALQKNHSCIRGVPPR